MFSSIRVLENKAVADLFVRKIKLFSTKYIWLANVSSLPQSSPTMMLTFLHSENGSFILSTPEDFCSSDSAY